MKFKFEFSDFESISETTGEKLIGGFSQSYGTTQLKGDPVPNNCAGGNCVSGCGTGQNAGCNAVAGCGSPPPPPKP